MDNFKIKLTKNNEYQLPPNPTLSEEKKNTKTGTNNLKSSREKIVGIKKKTCPSLKGYFPNSKTYTKSKLNTFY